MFRLNNGVEIPEMGLGVYKMNAGKEMDDAVRYAYEQGYRLFDTAQMYKNESGLGEPDSQAGYFPDQQGR